MFRTAGVIAQANSFQLPFPNGFFHAVVTSPPYWPHRIYKGVQEINWPDVHFNPNKLMPSRAGMSIGVPSPLGMEDYAFQHISHMVLIAREIKRVLRDDGSFWLNYGDAMIDGDLVMMPAQIAIALQADGWILRNDNVWFKQGGTPEPRMGPRWEKHRLKIESADVDWKKEAEARGRKTEGPGHIAGGNTSLRGHKPKYEMCPGCKKCAPDGYILKQGSWRHTRNHEFVFHFVKKMKNWADHTIVREMTSEDSHGSVETGAGKKQESLGQNQGPSTLGVTSKTRNPRTVWPISTASFKGKHFAVYPEQLIKVPILSSVPRKACSNCGKGWAPVIERTKHPDRDSEKDRRQHAEQSGRTDGLTGGPSNLIDETVVIGYRPICGCCKICDHVDRLHSDKPCEPYAPVAGWVLDPFFGSGTTGKVARSVGVNFAGTDLSFEYLSEIARVRALGGTPPEALIDLPMFKSMEEQK